MKRTHTQEPERYGHHERASVAVRIAREVRKLFAPVRLLLLAIEMRSLEQHFANQAALQEAGCCAMKSTRRKMARVEEKCLAIKRGIQ